MTLRSLSMFLAGSCLALTLTVSCKQNSTESGAPSAQVNASATAAKKSCCAANAGKSECCEQEMKGEKGDCPAGGQCPEKKEKGDN